MKPITFENLRRLVGAGRKKKERQESSFKRSDSFKRISIRKNYLENRGGKGRAASKSVADKEKAPIEEEIVDIPESLVIGYGQWIKCMRAEDYEHLKELSKTGRDVPPTPPPRKKYSSPSIDSSLEILKLDTSPVPVRRRLRKVTPPASNFFVTKEERADSGLSVSLGRVWMDAPLAMANAPRSLELPRPSPSVETDPGGRRVHHSLESALKERRDDKPFASRRFHHYPSRPLSPTPFVMPNPSAVCRTLSSTTQTTSSKTTSTRGSHELLSSSKDSGFSFSISIPRLSDLSPTGGGGGFFGKKKPSKPPKLSVSQDGYFKRTSNPPSEIDGSGSCRKKKNSRKKSTTSENSIASGTERNEMYQVVINRPPRSLQSLKLDPMIFVPPERRKPSSNPNRRTKLEVLEIRDYCSPKDVQAVDSDEDEGLYECISGDFEGDSGDERPSTISFLTLSDADADSEDEEDEDDDESAYAPVYRDNSPPAARRPLRWKKSVKKGVKYVAKPSIHRAPSTLKRNKKLLKKGRWPHVVSRY